MPRARNIKPSLFKNEVLGKADPLLTILFASLWCLADRRGRLEDRPERIGIETFPYLKEVSTDSLLYELQEKGFIKRYSCGESRYIQVINFLKHQKPHHTEKESVIPECDSKSLIIKGPEKITVKEPLNNVKPTVVERSDLLIPDLLIPDSRFLITEKAPTKKNQDLDFEKFWEMYPKRPGANKSQALKAWLARLKDGATIEEMQQGCYRYRVYCRTMNVEPQYVKQASTFLGPDKHYLNDWKAHNRNQDFADRLTGKRGDDEYIIDS